MPSLQWTLWFSPSILTFRLDHQAASVDFCSILCEAVSVSCEGDPPTVGHYHLLIAHNQK